MMRDLNAPSAIVSMDRETYESLVEERDRIRKELEEARELLARYIFIVATEADSEAVLDAVHGFSDDIRNFLQRTENP